VFHSGWAQDSSFRWMLGLKEKVFKFSVIQGWNFFYTFFYLFIFIHWLQYNQHMNGGAWYPKKIIKYEIKCGNFFSRNSHFFSFLYFLLTLSNRMQLYAFKSHKHLSSNKTFHPSVPICIFLAFWKLLLMLIYKRIFFNTWNCHWRDLKKIFP
jgi:hypothetical protein